MCWYASWTPCTSDTMTTTATGLVGLEVRVREFCDEVRAGSVSSDSLMRLEEGVREDLDAIGRAAMKQALQSADFDDSEVWINRVQHGRVRRFTEVVHTSFGGVSVDKTSYRKDGKSPPVTAMDKALGLVEGGYTPKAAKITCLLTALVVREDVVKIVGEFGGMTMGSATLYRVPQVVMARDEVRRPQLEKAVRERSTLPPPALLPTSTTTATTWTRPTSGGCPKRTRRRLRSNSQPRPSTSRPVGPIFDRSLPATARRGSGPHLPASGPNCREPCNWSPSTCWTSSTWANTCRTPPTPSTASRLPRRVWPGWSGSRRSRRMTTGSNASANPCAASAATRPSRRCRRP